MTKSSFFNKFLQDSQLAVYRSLKNLYDDDDFSRSCVNCENTRTLFDICNYSMWFLHRLSNLDNCISLLRAVYSEFPEIFCLITSPLDRTLILYLIHQKFKNVYCQKTYSE